MTPSQPRILLSAGEPSGDLHGARIVAAFKRRFPHAIVHAVGGPLMEEAGARLVCSIDELSTLGVLETLERLPAHFNLYRRLKRDLRAQAYQLVIPIDYPGFNLHLSQASRATGVPVLYYIAPQLWAWRPGRARRFARAVDRMAVILPFEEEFFNRVGLASTFVGHPLLDGPPWPDRQEARARLDIPAEDRVLAIFPGSRRQEIRTHWETFRQVAAALVSEGRCDRVLVGGTGGGEYPDPGPTRLVRGQSRLVLAAADAALVKSGTTTLEAAVAGTPMVVSYRVHPFTAFVVRRLVTVEWASLVNLIAGRAVVPEVLQEDVSHGRLLTELRPLLKAGSPERQAQLDALAGLRRSLGRPGAADRVVDLASDLVPAWR